MLALTVIYRVARPGEERLRNVLPGAMVATSLWWLVNVLFGILCAPRAVQRGLRRARGGHRIDALDATFRGDCIFGRSLERGTGGEPRGERPSRIGLST